MWGRDKIHTRGDSACSRRERGVVAVEFALVLPLLAMLLLGTVTAGIAFSHSLGLTNAVREGSRFGATTQYPATTGSWAADVIQRTRDTQFDDPDIESKVCVELHKQGVAPLVATTCAGGEVGWPAPPAFTIPAGTPIGTCVVRVWAAREFTINAILVKFDQRLMSKESMAMYDRASCGAS